MVAKMIIKNKEVYTPLDPQGIIDMFDENFKGKPKSMEMTQAIGQFKKDWVKSVLDSDMSEKALWEYISSFTRG